MASSAPSCAEHLGAAVGDRVLVGDAEHEGALAEERLGRRACRSWCSPLADLPPGPSCAGPHADAAAMRRSAVGSGCSSGGQETPELGQERALLRVQFDVAREPIQQVEKAPALLSACARASARSPGPAPAHSRRYRTAPGRSRERRRPASRAAPHRDPTSSRMLFIVDSRVWRLPSRATSKPARTAASVNPPSSIRARARGIAGVSRSTGTAGAVGLRLCGADQAHRTVSVEEGMFSTAASRSCR